MIRLDAQRVDIIKRHFDIDLLDFRAPQFQRINEDSSLLIAVLYFVCLDQAQALGIELEQFAALFPPTVEPTVALCEEIRRLFVSQKVFDVWEGETNGR